MKHCLVPIVGVTAAMLSGSVLAAPSVSGHTISWPDDGWYQVQSNDGSETYCNGGSSCEVPAGTYLVINHHTGQRFNDILVNDSGSGITVSGNTISWPDDGWYQVQSNDGAETFCNGGSSCTVAPGSYLVINHDTGQRHHDILVGDGTATVEILAGNIIRWSDDGWYQVLRADDFSEVCAGGSQCIVGPAGDYIVINHDTGVRTMVSIERTLPVLDDHGSRWDVTTGQELTDPFSPDNLGRTLTVLGWLDSGVIFTSLRDEAWNVYLASGAGNPNSNLDAQTQSCEAPESGSLAYSTPDASAPGSRIVAENCRLDDALYNADFLWTGGKYGLSIGNNADFTLLARGHERNWEDVEVYIDSLGGTGEGSVRHYTESRDGVARVTLNGFDRCYTSYPLSDEVCHGITAESLEIDLFHTLEIEPRACGTDGIAEFGDGCHYLQVRDSAGSQLLLSQSAEADNAIRVRLTHANGAEANITFINGERFVFSRWW